MTLASSALFRRARSGLFAVALASAAVVAMPASAAAKGASYVVMLPGGHSSAMNGNSEDWARAKSLQAGDSGLLYFRDGRGAYVVRDAAFMRRAAAIIAPQQELGERQGALGSEQGKLGARQGALGAEQARAGSAERQAELGRQQAALGREQAALGARQAELGRQQAALAKRAEGQFKALIDDAIRQGRAERIR